MIDLTRLAIVSSLTTGLALALPGCGESSSPDASTHSAEDGHDHGEGGREAQDHASGGHDDHDHGEESHDDQDHAPGEHDDHDHEHDGDGHDEARPLGTVDVGGTTLDVSISGDLEPGTLIEVDLDLTGGPVPAAVRLWIGDETGTGVLKSKADGQGGHYHGHAEAPSDVEGASLWIEIEAVDGTRESGAVPLG